MTERTSISLSKLASTTLVESKPNHTISNMEATVEYSEREKEVKQFEDSKAGVKGLVDSGITKIPRIFIHPPDDFKVSPSFEVPLIDLQGIDGGRERRKEIVEGITGAAETWGFFKIINHGIPINILEEILQGVRRFHEQPHEYKKGWYSKDFSRPAIYYSNGDLKASTPTDWRDSFTCRFKQNHENFDALPHVCREEIEEFFKRMSSVRDMISEVLSEALGLRSDYLTSIGCLKSASILGHYYPICPEPDLTIGATKHSDMSFLTLLLQDNQGGLQVDHQNHWVNVPPVKGALVVNMGDFMQIISNDKFKSVEHRVLATRATEPRISVATFFGAANNDLQFGPIKELLSDENPPINRDTTFGEYVTYYRSKDKRVYGNSALPHLKINK
ncbi:1-aminocyclopropane-1-carboxylate oxidase homolog 1-like [Humulus lupulus]|uniref:1-aminocyclopropane-1-carboxylate oxidase homolog 1-like n=1 Tax=Humulus lupulus TaxID=3486 RepID=UPI002B404E36|nr:1-aminocyclopropane-1-carboxylate oxidase homolog 1-like [Humulus lupulus]